MNSYPVKYRFQYQQGLTLVELLVALTLGLVVTATILQIYLSSKQAYQAQEQNSRMQENGSYAVELLSRYIRLAGYRSNLTVDSYLVFPHINADQVKDGCGQQNKSISATSQLPSSGKSQVITGGDEQDVYFEDDDGNCDVAEIDGKKYKSDWLIIRYYGSDDGSMTDCFGSNKIEKEITNDHQIIMNAFFIREDDTDQIAKSADYDKYKTFSLFCQRKVFDENTRQQIGATQTEAFARGIENMQIQYGVNSTGDLTKGVTAYLDANQIHDDPEQKPNWSNVISVKIALLVKSEINVTNQKQSYTFPPWDEKSLITSDDYRLRRVFVTTINLRNQSLHH